MTLNSGTLALNYASNDGGGIRNTDTAALNNSIVAGNNAGRSGGNLNSMYGSAPICSGVNVIGDVGLDDAHRIFETDLTEIFETGQLGFNGSSRQTLAIKRDGTAYNTGDASQLPEDLHDTDGDNDFDEPLPTDARGNGYKRVNFGFLDIGAFELGDAIGDSPAPPPPNLAPPTKLFATVRDLNEAVASGGSIGTANDPTGHVVAILSTFDSDLPTDSHTYTIVDPSGLFEVSNNFIVVKAGAVIDFETATSHDIEVTTTDIGGLTFTKTITIDVTNYAEKYIGTNGADTQTGTSEEDLMSGRKGNDDLKAGDGNDILKGQKGRDKLDGGAGKDLIRGNADADWLTGGADADIFDFNKINHIGRWVGNRDIITDFEPGVDRIDISDIDAKKPVAGFLPLTANAGDQAFDFIGTDNFSGTKGELRYHVNPAGNTIVAGDCDGDGRADFKLELTGIHALDADDFIL
jgi:hypothetical protein